MSASKEEKGTSQMNEVAIPQRGARFADHNRADESTSPNLQPTVTTDTEKRSTAYADSETGLTLHQDRVKAERHLLWKLGQLTFLSVTIGGRRGLRAIETSCPTGHNTRTFIVPPPTRTPLT